MKTAEILLSNKTIDDYRYSLRAAARSLWNDENLSAFFSLMLDTVDRNLSAAWFIGMRACGIAPNEITSEEDAARVSTIVNSTSRIGELGSYILLQKRSGNTVDSIFWRLDLWANRWNEAINQARQLACRDQKLVWVLGPTEHCGSCLSMAGKVKRASQWAASDIRPQSGSLECGGFRCQCSLEPTDAALSYGRLPRLRGR